MAQEVIFNLDVKTGSSGKSIGELTEQLKKFREQLKQTESGSDAFNNLNKNIAETSSLINGLDPESKAKGFDALGQSMSGAFKVGAESFGLFGESGKEVEEALKKASKATELFSTISSKVGDRVKDLKANKNAIDEVTGAERKSIVAKEASAVATGVGTNAFKLLKLAIISTGIGAFVVGLGLLVANFDKIKAKVEELYKPLEKVGGIATYVKSSFSASFEFIKVLFTDLAESVKLFFNGDFSKAADKLTNSFEDAGKAAGKAFDKGIKEGTAEKALEDQGKRLVKQIQGIEIEISKTSADNADKQFKLKKEQYDKELELLRIQKRKELKIKGEEGDEARKEINDQQIKINELVTANADRLKKDREAASKKNSDDAKKLSDDELKNLKALNDEKNRLRLLNAKDEQDAFDIQEKILDENYVKEIANTKLTDTQKLVIQAKYNADKQALANQANKSFIDKEKEAAANLLKQQQDDAQKELEFQKTITDEKNKLRLLGAKSETEAIAIQQQILDETFQNEIKGLEEGSSQKLAIEAKYETDKAALKQQSADIAKQIAQQENDAAIALIQDSINAINTIINRRADEQSKKNDKKYKDDKKALEDKFKNELISKEEFDKQVKALDEKADKEKRRLEHDAALQRKKQSIIDIIINTAIAVSKSNPNPILMAFAALTGGIQIGLVSSQQIPELAKGGIAGRKYQGGGRISEGTTGTADDVPVMLSRGESVINARSTQMFGGLLSSLNQAGGGRAFAQGGVIPDFASSSNNGFDLNGLAALINGNSNVTPVIKTYVVESEITSSQREVNTIERRARF